MDGGTWRIVANPRRIVTGDYDYWLPSGQSVLEGTKFLFPDPDRTFTEPAGTSKAIAVAAYDTSTQSYAPFSGHGFPQAPGDIHPVIAALGGEYHDSQSRWRLCRGHRNILCHSLCHRSLCAFDGMGDRAGE